MLSPQRRENPKTIQVKPHIIVEQEKKNYSQQQLLLRKLSYDCLQLVIYKG